MPIIVSVDPATGSSSFPGYAVWLLGNGRTTLLKSGVLQVKGDSHWKRMRNIALMLPGTLTRILGGTQLLDDIKALIIEGLPPTLGINSGGKHFGVSNKATVHLHHSVAVIATCLDFPLVDELSPQTWKSFLVHLGLDKAYIKSDANDAIIIAVAWMCCNGLPIPTIDPQTLERMFGEVENGHPFRTELWNAWHMHITKSREKSSKRGK